MYGPGTQRSPALWTGTPLGYTISESRAQKSTPHMCDVRARRTVSPPEFVMKASAVSSKNFRLTSILPFYRHLDFLLSQDRSPP